MSIRGDGPANAVVLELVGDLAEVEYVEGHFENLGDLGIVSFFTNIK
ncbi:hypothetical protein IMZ48_38325 [Candidatus Bathyarchaeota archaeon]|nr:hypothetical protein [Candidatus Bathyarchaeota archaeon]